jgi:predicted esterase
MENMIREIQVQVEFYSNRFQADGHRTDREMMEFYQNWLSQLIVDQKNINA